MGGVGKPTRGVEGAGPGRAKRPAGQEAPPRRIAFDGRAHRIRPENETESGVTFVTEKGRKG